MSFADYLYTLEQQYNGFIINNSVYFYDRDDCEKACDYLNSLLVMNKLGG